MERDTAHGSVGSLQRYFKGSARGGTPPTEQCPTTANMFINHLLGTGNVLSILQVSSSSPTTIVLLFPSFRLKKIGQLNIYSTFHS